MKALRLRARDKVSCAATIIWQGNPDSAAAYRVRRQATWIARLNLLLTLMLVAGGVVLVRGVPW